MPPGTRILAQPNYAWRRLTPHAYSLDWDILSFVPYKPAWSGHVIRELALDYGLDVKVLVRSKTRIYHSINETKWMQIKQIAMARRPSAEYRYIIERNSSPPTNHIPIVFENTKYRISRINYAPANQGLTKAAS